MSRRDKFNCHECRYCCTLPLCSYINSHAGKYVSKSVSIIDIYVFFFTFTVYRHLLIYSYCIAESLNLALYLWAFEYVSPSLHCLLLFCIPAIYTMFRTEKYQCFSFGWYVFKNRGGSSWWKLFCQQEQRISSTGAKYHIP